MYSFIDNYIFGVLVVLPDYIAFDRPFLEKPIRNVVRRCVEHGIWSALRSVANHLSKISKFRSRNHDATLTDYESHPLGLWLLLVTGWTSACLVFGVEICLIHSDLKICLLIRCVRTNTIPYVHDLIVDDPFFSRIASI